MKRIFASFAAPLFAMALSSSAHAHEAQDGFTPEGQCFDYLPKGNMSEILPASDPFHVIYALRDSGSAQSKEQMQGLAYLIAQEAVDYAFADAPSSMQRYADRLNAYLQEIPNASLEEKERLNADIYNLRINLERQGFKYHYVQAAQAVFAASLSTEEINLHGHDQSIVMGDAEWVSLYATLDALESVIVFENKGNDREIRRQGAEAVISAVEELQSGCGRLDASQILAADPDYIIPRDIENWSRWLSEQQNHIDARQIVSDAVSELDIRIP